MRSYQAKMDQDSSFEVRIHGGNNNAREILPYQLQIGYKIYGPEYDLTTVLI
mgnify:CR=1 FL=1